MNPGAPSSEKWLPRVMAWTARLPGHDMREGEEEGEGEGEREREAEPAIAKARYFRFTPGFAGCPFKKDTKISTGILFRPHRPRVVQSCNELQAHDLLWNSM